MISIWSDSVKFPSFEQLKKNIKTDVLIIGGGDHRTGKHGGNWQEISEMESSGGFMGLPLSRLPFY